MANALYDKYREACLSGTPVVSWSADTIKCGLARGYTPNLGTHQFLSDFTGAGGTVVGTAATLASKTVANGIADAADVTFTAVPAGAACPHILIYKDTGTAGTSPLIALIDTATGLPFTPNGGDCTISWDNTTTTRIFKL
jgi:hypothetical protein